MRHVMKTAMKVWLEAREHRGNPIAVIVCGAPFMFEGISEL